MILQLRLDHSIYLVYNFLLTPDAHACFCLALPSKAYSEYHDSQKLPGKWKRKIFTKVENEKLMTITLEFSFFFFLISSSLPEECTLIYLLFSSRLERRLMKKNNMNQVNEYLISLSIFYAWFIYILYFPTVN